MSEQLTSQSRSNESGITRRTALRGAAWSASAVTVVVATPNIAAATVTGTASGSMTRADKTARGTATLVNGSAAIGAGTLELTIEGGALPSNFTPSAGWQRIGTSTTRFLYSGMVDARGAAVFEVAAPAYIDLSSNGQSVTLVVRFKVGSLELDSLTYAFTSKNHKVAGV